MEAQTHHSIWIHWARRIVSFQKEPGFEELQYSTYEEKLRFAVEKGFDGFFFNSIWIIHRLILS